MNISDFEEKLVSSEKIFEGKIVKLYFDQITLPDGKPATREYLRHPGAVCVVPLTDNDEVLCVRQYRYPLARVTLEIPAGKLDNPNENHRAAAIRELKEETGATCEELVYIGEFYSSPAILDEVIHMYYAKGLSFGQTSPDDDEFIEPERIPLAELKQMIVEGKIRDSKTQAAVLKTALILGK